MLLLGDKGLGEDSSERVTPEAGRAMALWFQTFIRPCRTNGK